MVIHAYASNRGRHKIRLGAYNQSDEAREFSTMSIIMLRRLSLAIWWASGVAATA